MSLRNIAPSLDTTDTLYSKFKPRLLLEAMEINTKFVVKYEFINKYYIEFNIPTIFPLYPEKNPDTLKQMLKGICYLSLAFKAKNEIDLACNKSEIRNSYQEVATLRDIYKNYLTKAQNCGNYLATYLLLLENITTDLEAESIDSCFKTFENLISNAHYFKDENIIGPVHGFYKASIFYHFVKHMNDKILKQPANSMLLFKNSGNSVDATNAIAKYVNKIEEILVTFDPYLVITDEKTTKVLLAFNSIRPLNKTIKEVKADKKEFSNICTKIREDSRKFVAKTNKSLGL